MKWNAEKFCITDPPSVWIVLKCYEYEGADVLAVFDNKDAAHTCLAQQTPPDQCKWYEAVKHEVRSEATTREGE